MRRFLCNSPKILFLSAAILGGGGLRISTVKRGAYSVIPFVEADYLGGFLFNRVKVVFKE